MFNRQNLFWLNSRVFLTILILISSFFVLPAKPLLADEEDDGDEQEIITIIEDKTLTEDMNGSIIIGADDITLDCDGHKIIGFGADDGGQGVYLYGKNNVTVKNCVIENCYSGIYSDYSTNSAFVKNNISNNEMGIFLICSSDNKISENNIFNNELGLGISNVCPASDNLVYHNNFKNNQDQAFLDDSHNDLFDNSYSDGGNYWSDYDTPAKGCNNADGDNFCNAPYIFMNDGEDRYPFIKENGWEESEASEWRRSILAGDILYDPFVSGVGHVGLYIGDDKVIEAIGYPVWQSGYPGKVKEKLITAWDYPKKDNVYLLRVKKPSGLNDTENTEWDKKISDAVNFAKKATKSNS